MDEAIDIADAQNLMMQMDPGASMSAEEVGLHLSSSGRWRRCLIIKALCHTCTDTQLVLRGGVGPDDTGIWGGEKLEDSSTQVG